MGAKQGRPVRDERVWIIRIDDRGNPAGPVVRRDRPGFDDTIVAHVRFNHRSATAISNERSVILRGGKPQLYRWQKQSYTDGAAS